MRIVLVNDRVTPAGGSEHTLRAQIAGLVARGHQLLVVAPPAEAEAGARDPEFAGVEWHAAAPGTGLFSARPAALGILAAAGRFGADLIEVVNLGGFLGPRGTLRFPAALPLVHACRDVRPTCPRTDRALPGGGLCHDPMGRICLQRHCMGPEHEPRGWRGLLDYRLRFRALSQAGAVVVEGRAVSELLQDLGIPTTRIHMPPLYVKSPPLPPPPPSEAPPQVLGIGLLNDPRKGLEHLARAFATVKTRGARLRLTGKPGPAWAQLKALVDELEVAGRIDVLGWLDDAQLFAELARARVAAFPSRFFESFGLAGAEAAAAGRPVVAVDCGGPSEWLLDGETGAIVDREHPAAMGAALARYLEDPALADAHGQAGREHVTGRFTLEAFLAGTERVYEAVLSEAGTPAASRA